MKLLIKEQQESYENEKSAIFVKKKLKINRQHIAYAADSTCSLKYSVSKRIPIIHNGFNQDYDFIIKELAEELKIQFICLGENTAKYITFTVPIGKVVTKIDKIREEITKHESYILQFINNVRFITSSLSN